MSEIEAAAAFEPLVIGPLSTNVMGAVSDEQAGTASDINNAISRVAGLVAVASMGSVAAVSYGMAGGPASFAEIGGSKVLRAAIDARFQAILWVTSGLAAASAIIAWLDLGAGDRAPDGRDAKLHAQEQEAPETGPETQGSSQRTPMRR